MQKNSNRKGLALGAVFALVASLFATAPASAATDGANIGAYPVLGTTFAGVVTEDFPVYAQLKPGNPNADFTASNVVFKVEKTAGTAMDVAISASAAAISMQDATSESHTVDNEGNTLVAGSTSTTVSAVISSNGIAHLNFAASSASAYASWSAVTLKVTAWIDTQGGAKNDVIDSDEWFTTFTVTLVRPESLTGTPSITAANTGDEVVTVSATVGGANLANLSGEFYLAMSSSGLVYSTGANASSASVRVGTEVAAATLALRSGVLSQSFAVEPDSMSANASLSAAVRYLAPTSNAGNIYAGLLVGAVTKVGVAAVAADALVLTVVESDHAKGTAQSVQVRPNQTYTVRVHAKDGGVSESDVAVTIKFAGSTALVTGSKTVSINGGAELTSYPASVTVTTGADGYATWTMKTTGFAANDVIDVQATVGNTSATELTMTATAPIFSIVNDYTEYVTAPGAAVNITYAVEDQWEVASTRTDQRIMVTRGGAAFNYAETVSYVAVVAGKATFAFTPAPATATGSATVASALQRLNTDTNVWAAEASTVQADAVNVTVTSVASTFSALSKVSQSASVSYFPSTVSYKTVTVKVTNDGESVSVTGPAALIFRQTDKTATASGAITLRADGNGLVSLDVASLLEGSHTITFTVGAVSTTSLLVVDPAAGNSGVKVSFDKSSIVAGETSTITGKVTDANGNPVNTETDGSDAEIVLSYAGKGLPFNIQADETDEKGEFKVNILALPGDVGTGTLTATYRPAGDVVDTKNVTATQVITIAAPAAVAGPEINAVIGTFNGRWAVRVENAKGAVVSVKVGNRWVKYTSLNDNYLFSRKSRVGATLPVAVYVNGQLENVATITIK
jgi:hypothetical protein